MLCVTTLWDSKPPSLGQEGPEEGQAVGTGRALPAGGSGGMKGEAGACSPALPPPVHARPWGSAREGGSREEHSEEFGLLSQLLFIFCALKSLEI